ncbi:MAG: NAD(P)-binding domain-containing protein [Thermomicrobiales bacterium]
MIGTRISVFGLGKLGLSMAATFAASGFETIGCDVTPAFVEALAAGRARVAETDLQRTIDLGRGKLRATGNTREAVLASDISLVIVPTPSGPGGGFGNDWEIDAIRAIGAALGAHGRIGPKYLQPARVRLEVAS